MADSQDLMNFIDAAPSPYHATFEVARRLAQRGFEEVPLKSEFPSRTGSYFVQRGGALIAWTVPQDTGSPHAFRIVGAHSDSPNLRIKPQPDIGNVNTRQLAVEVYGGALWNSWLDRDLGLSGRIFTSGPGAVTEHLFRVDRALLRVPQLAIHLDRDVNTSGLKLNPQVHLNPIWGSGSIEVGGFREFLANQIGVDANTIIGWDAMAHDLTPSSFLGVDNEFIAAPRLDNLLSCWAAVEAVSSVANLSKDRSHIAVAAIFDHEEVGSASTTGADGVLLGQILERITSGLGGSRQDFLALVQSSACVSADGAHGTHPNYPERHDGAHNVLLNGGPVIKINSNQRYSTDPEARALLNLAFEQAEVAPQFFVSRNDMGCGSTIGPALATRLAIPTVDMGVAMLSMHSAREMCGAHDPSRLGQVLKAFLST